MLEQIGDTFAQTMLKSKMGLRVYSFREEKETRKYWVFNTMVSLPTLQFCYLRARDWLGRMRIHGTDDY